MKEIYYIIQIIILEDSPKYNIKKGTSYFVNIHDEMTNKLYWAQKFSTKEKAEEHYHKILSASWNTQLKIWAKIHKTKYIIRKMEMTLVD